MLEMDNNNIPCHGWQVIGTEFDKKEKKKVYFLPYPDYN